MKKIAFFIHNFNGGGAEKITIKTATELQKRGYNVSIIVRENTGELSNSIPKDIELVDLEINQHSKIIKNIKNINKLRKELTSKKYDYIFSVTFNMSILAGISKVFKEKELKMYAIIHTMSSMDKNKFYKIKRVLMKFVQRKFDKIIFVSEGARKDYIDMMEIKENKTVTIYNPVVSSEIEKMANEKCDIIKNDNFKQIINIGRLTRVKNQIMLLEAINMIKDKINLKLIILGEGELRYELDKYVKENGLEEIVLLKGYTDNPYKYIKNSDLLVLSSDYEGLPTVLIEALACGCNVISTDCPTGPREILDYGKYGKLVRVGDKVSLASGILDKLSNEMIDSEILKKRAELFSVKNSIDKYIEVMRESNGL